MPSKNTKKKVASIFILGLIFSGALGFFYYNAPHRDVQGADADYKLTAKELVVEYLENSEQANQKYLSQDGDSKILEINGVVSEIVTDFENNKVVLLESNIRGVGVRCTFTSDSNQHTANISVGEEITVKGVILVGASYDSELEMFEDAVLNKCYLIN